MSTSSDETIPQIALFIQESSVRPPPPPPQAASSSVPWVSARAPRPVNVAMQHLQPPPPPPSVPSTSGSQLQKPVYRGQTPQPSTSFASGHPSATVPIFRFDARRPPPPLHTHVQLNNNTLTRTMSSSCTATPSKLRKMEEPKHDDALCDVCVQREISIESYRIKMDKISAEDECQSLLLKKKQHEYQRQKDLLRSIVDSDLFRKVEEFVEDVPQYNFQSVLNNLNDSILTGLTSSIPNQMQLQLIDYCLSDSSQFERSFSIPNFDYERYMTTFNNGFTPTESSQSVRAEDSLRQTLSAMSRSNVSRSFPELLQTLQDMLLNEDRSNTSERPGYGDLSAERARSSGTNGVSSLCRYSNGQRLPPAPAPAPASAPVAPPAPLAAPPPAVTYPHYPPPSTVTYPHYPTPRAYFPPHYLPGPRPTTSRTPMPPRPPHVERYPPPYYYY